VAEQGTLRRGGWTGVTQAAGIWPDIDLPWQGSGMTTGFFVILDHCINK
jgi:hypothetical protein